MSTRRLHDVQPESFQFSPENDEWARGQIAKFPPGRQASAVIPLLFRAQEQEGWLSRPAIEHVAAMLEMPFIRALEVATFYFMFKLAPIGQVAHIEVCGTTPCMLCGSEGLIEVLKKRVSATPHTVSADGKFSWEEVECLGACANAPMIQVGKDYYEDLTPRVLDELIDGFAAAAVGERTWPRPGPQNGRFASEPLGLATSLTGQADAHDENASVGLATGVVQGPRRISGGVRGMRFHRGLTPDGRELIAGETAAPETDRPRTIDNPADGGDDLKQIRGVGDQLEALLRRLGYHYYWQIASWTPANITWVDQHLAGFRGRIERDDWVTQAQALANAARGVDA